MVPFQSGSEQKIGSKSRISVNIHQKIRSKAVSVPCSADFAFDVG